MTRNDMRITVSLASLILLCCGLQAQDPASIRIPNDYGLVHEKQNVIIRPNHLESLFEKLYRLKTAGQGLVSMVHIGDSHIQADILTQQVRQQLQLIFGNAGRGLVVPGKVARTNEASTILSSSNVTWDAKRAVFPEQPLPIGIGGITISTNDPTANLTLKMVSPWTDYRFNKVTVFLQKNFESFNMAVRDSANRDLAFVGPYTFEPFPNTSTIHLPFLTNQISLQAMKSIGTQKNLTLFGMSLENGNPGLFYHAIGVNGAKYRHYLAAQYFTEQTAVLEPDLFVISLGTNEALDYPNVDPQLFTQIGQLMVALRTRNPAAVFLLITPPDSFRNQHKRNPGVEDVRETILRFADDNRLAVFDLFEAGGGHHSASKWKHKDLLRADGIHFTKEGYELQGNMFYNAFMKAYLDYVATRHP
ncbi:MAG: hypothetical protein K1X47_06850 [Cyclobacteriaceae bacterium]|nr:hypothetical protein [Cyclobacteriaceae bacterium]